MGVQRLNHAVLYVRDVEQTTEFYSEVLGFRVVSSLPGAAFLQAPDSTNDHDLGVFQIGAGAAPSDAGRSTVGLYHLAWEVDTLGELRAPRRRTPRTWRTRGGQRPRHHEEPLREGPGRARVRGRLDHPCPPADARRPRARGCRSVCSTSRRRSNGSASTNPAASASPPDPESNLPPPPPRKPFALQFGWPPQLKCDANRLRVAVAGCVEFPEFSRRRRRRGGL